MKILYICPRLPSNGINSGSSRMFELIKRLAVRNDVSVISFLLPEEERFLLELKKICRRVDVINKDFPWRPNILSILPPMVEEFACKTMEDLIKKRLSDDDFDILHFEYLVMAQYAPRKCEPVKFLTEHELEFLSKLRNLRIKSGIWNKIKIWGSAVKLKIYEINISKRFNKIITMTENEAEILRSYTPWLDASPLPIGRDHIFFSPFDQIKEDIDIIYVGFYRHRPNVDAVLYFYHEIFPFIRKVYPLVNFTIVGYDPPDSILALKNDANVNVEGYVDDIRPYLARSKVVVAPIRLGSGMRGKVIEAWAMAKPVVSTSIGCEGVDAIEGENILIADDPEDFAGKINTLLHSPQKRKYLGQNGRKLIEQKFNWDILADKLKGMYKEKISMN